MKKEALEYHECPIPGKIAIFPTKPYSTQKDLTLAYSPGVAEACTAIHTEAEDVYTYTNKGNLVGIITDGTAVLGLGNIGALGAKPVMEGKSLLFKIFSGVDAFDIELKTNSQEHFVDVVKALEPTLGGINLEDIKAPECFYIEETLKKALSIPVFHDDQHGTAIISGAGLLNALELVNKDITKAKVIVYGAGAAAIMCARMYCTLGVQKDNLYMFDSKGLLYNGRTDLNKYKMDFVQKHNSTLQEILKGADVFLGLSVKDVLTKEMVQSMSKEPIIFALANPNPEISYKDAKDAVPNAIVGTGRSDCPNQINNVSGFPYIFRAALDCRATEITIEMQLALVHALRDIAKMPVSEEVKKGYPGQVFEFGKDYIIPKPTDPRILEIATPQIVEAAMKCGVAKNPIKDLEAYRKSLLERIRRVHSCTKNILEVYSSK